MMTGTQSPTSLEVRDFGCIAYMCMPPGWTAPPERVGPGGTADNLKFFAPGSTDIGIALLYSMRPLHPMYKDSIISIFDQPPHSVTPGELAKINDLVRGAADMERFKALHMKTEAWNDRMVLRLEGRWIEKNLYVLWLLTDPNGERDKLQEVMFSAPTNDYPMHYQSVLTSFRSIGWK